MIKNIDYIIYYEHVTRELESVKKVKTYLDSMGYKGVILPIHYNRYLNVIKYKPKVVIVPFLYSKNNSTYLKYKKLYGNVKCLNLHSEQISNENTVDFMMPKDEYSRNVFHIAWGDKFAKSLIKSGVGKEKIFITGSIRNDSIFDYKSNSFDNDNILIPTSFSLTMVSDEYIKNLEQDYERKKLDRNIKFMKKSRDEFLRLIHKASINFRNKRFYLRPHPHVDISIYINVFKKVNNINEVPENIIFERKGSIQNFFSKGKKIIAWHSTSILEGAMMNKDVAILAPFKFPDHMYMDFMPFIKSINSEKDLFEFIKKEKNEQKEIANYLYNNFYEIDGFSSLRVAKTISNIIEKKNINYNFNRKYFLVLLKKSLLIDLPKNLLLKLNLLDKINSNYKGIIEDSIVISNNYNKNINSVKLNFIKGDNGIYVEVN